EEWRGPAIAGDADAQYNLGQAYKLGRGVPVDPALAQSWFRRAAVQGHEQAEDNYGLALFEAGRAQEAVPWLEKAAARDERRAELVLGTMLFNGDGGLTRDYPRAYALMTRASQQGLASASETLAQMDQYMNNPDRERGTALAQRYAADAAARPKASLPEPAPVRTAALTPARSPAPKAGAQPSPKPKPTPATAPTKRAPLQLAPGADAPAPMMAAEAKGWKVQLGAFRDRGNAEALWSRVHAKLGGNVAPAYVDAGGLTRLQAFGFPSKAAAKTACARSGVTCVVVAP
ncbi:MAG: SEL1-like repeat protein, partial [Acetobacteraceae bacterium]|nr:SEL1-like repeat protein [Acetobacteraceae bacterium]